MQKPSLMKDGMKRGRVTTITNAELTQESWEKKTWITGSMVLWSVTSCSSPPLKNFLTLLEDEGGLGKLITKERGLNHLSIN